MPKFLRWAENSRLFKIVLSSWTMRVKSKSELVIFWTLREHWKREQNRNSKQEIPWLHGQDVPRTYYFFTVGLVKTNSIQLSLIDFAREILKVTNKFNLLYIIEFQKANKQTNKNQTHSQAFSLHWVSMVVGCNHEGLKERKNQNAISLKL